MASSQADVEEFVTETESEDGDCPRPVVKRWKIAIVAVAVVGLVGLGATVGVASMLLSKNKGVVLNLSGTVEELNESLDGHVRAVSPSWHAVDNGWKPSIADSYYFTQPPNFTEVDRPSYFVTVLSIPDVQKSLKFARDNNMTVTVKNAGHSYFAGGYGGQLIIFVGNFRYTDIQTSRNYCGLQHDSMEVSGGTPFVDMYKVILDNFTTVGGACPTVTAGGGWILGNGMSNEVLPMYGLGVDNVLQYDIILADGQLVQANKCSQPALFKTLRGGGGGFGVVTAVHYKLYPPTPLQYYNWTFCCDAHSNDPSNPNVSKRWDLFIRWAPRWDHRWSTKHISGAAIYTFLGTDAEAQATPFYQDATATFGPPGHTSWRSVLHWKLNAGGTNPAKDDTSGNPSSMRKLDAHYQGNWLIPVDYLATKPEEARDLFMNMSMSGALCPLHGEYLLLGKQNQITEATDSTSVNPATRRAAFQVTVCEKWAMDKLMAMFPDMCQGINHAAANLQDWQTKLWGSHYSTLLAMKKTVDPTGLFQCNQCVGSELPRN